MKFGIGILLLLGLLVAAVLMQRNLRSKALEERARAREGVEYEAGWGRVIVGAPSGAPPAGSNPTPPAAPQATTPKAAPREFRLTVQSGQSLSKICQEHYGSARAEWVNRLAQYNQLSSPADLKAGQELRLPPLETLLAERP